MRLRSIAIVYPWIERVVPVAEYLCPHCNSWNEIDALFCQACHFPLDGGSKDVPTTREKIEVETVVLAEIGFDGAEHPLQIPPTGIAIYSWTDHTPIAVVTSPQLVLGRSMPGQPDDARIIDLKSFDAFENGVSRRHAAIRQVEGGYEIIDLGSSNGTWLEKQRLVPRRSYPLPGVSRIVLGRLHLIVLHKAATLKVDLPEPEAPAHKRSSPPDTRTQKLNEE
jgi:hypothetical protein